MSQFNKSMAEMVTANIVAMKDQIGEPEDMVLQMIRDMEDTVCEARQNTPGTSREQTREINRMENELASIKQKANSLKILQSSSKTKEKKLSFLLSTK